METADEGSTLSMRLRCKIFDSHDSFPISESGSPPPVRQRNKHQPDFDKAIEIQLTAQPYLMTKTFVKQGQTATRTLQCRLEKSWFGETSSTGTFKGRRLVESPTFETTLRMQFLIPPRPRLTADHGRPQYPNNTEVTLMYAER